MRRRGRSTVAQERALSELAPRYLVTPPAQEEPSARGSTRGFPSKKEPSARGSTRGFPSKKEPSARGSARGFPSKREPSAGGSARGFPSQEERSARGLSSKKEPWDEAFGRPGPLLVEIGFGMGDALAAFAKVHEDWNCLGIEVYRPGIGALMLACEREEIGNVRIVEAEAMTVLRRHPPACMNRIHVFFPDPWPKKRHHKRRLVNAEFAQEAGRCLVPGGTLALATDWREYAEQMRLILDACPTLDGSETQRPPERPQTPFESKGAAAGHHITDLAYRRI